jgi:hypothetical protein
LQVIQQSGVFVEFDQFIHLGEKHERLLQNFIHLGEKCQTFPKSIHLGKENERIMQNLSSLVKNIRDPQNITLNLQTAVY